MASVHLNSGYHGGTTFQQFKYGNVLPEMLKMENKRKRKVAVNTAQKEKDKKRRRMDAVQPSGKKKKRHYGEGHEDVDMTLSQFEVAKKIFVDRLDEERKKRHEIEAQTRDQKFSTKYCELKQNLVTSSSVGSYIPEVEKVIKTL